MPVSINRVKNIWRIPVANDQAPQQITKKGGGFARLSKDRQYLYFHKTHPTNQIYRMPYPDGEEELVIEDTDISWGGWSLSDNGIYYVNDYTNDQKIEFYDFKSKTKKELITVPRRTISESNIIEYLEDEKALLFTRRGPQQFDIYSSPDPYIPEE